MHDVSGLRVAGVERLLLSHEPGDLRLLHLVPGEGQHPGLLHEAEDEGVVQPGVQAESEWPHPLNTGQVNAGQLVDANT